MWVEQDDEKTSINGQPSTNNNLSVGTGGGTASAGQTANGTTGNPSTITPVQSNQPKQDFATVQDYLKSNQPQSEALGQQFSSKLGESATNEKNAIAGAANQATNDVNAGSTSYDPNLVSKALASPTDVAGNPDQLNSFLKQWNATYTGPSSFEASNSYTPAATAANDAAQKAAQVKTTGGREQLLQDEFNVYGQGNKGLDQTLLQNSSAFPTIQNQGKAFSSIPDYLTAQAGNVNTAATAAQKAADTAKSNTQGAFANSLTNFQTDLNARTSAAQNTANTTTQKYQADLASGDPVKVQADLQAAGVDAATTKNITDYLSALNKDYQINPSIPSSYISNPAVDINNANVATTNDYAKAAALGKLTGVDYSGILNPADAAKAGTGTINQQAFKSNDLSSYLKQGLDTQDKSITTGQPNLKSMVTDPSNAQQGTQIGQRYVDAFKRAGSPGYGSNDVSKLPQQMQQMLSQINQYPWLVRVGPNSQLTQDPKYAAIGNLFGQINKYLQGTA